MAWRLVVIALATLVVAPVALAQAERDRVRLTPRGFSSATVVTVPVLAEFRRTGFDGDSGSWEGPVCERPPFSASVALTWRVSFAAYDNGVAAVRAALTFPWMPVLIALTPVRHVVAGRDVGPIWGLVYVTDSESPQGWHETGIGFPIGRGFYGAVGAWSGGNTFACVVRGARGPVRSGSWHLDTADAFRIGLEGSLPPAHVRARGSARRVAGTVLDSFDHPVAAATVALQRRAGRTWRGVVSGRTSSRGSYALRARRRGSYRVVATLAGSSARSRAVRAGR